MAVGSHSAFPPHLLLPIITITLLLLLISDTSNASTQQPRPQWRWVGRNESGDTILLLPVTPADPAQSCAVECIGWVNGAQWTGVKEDEGCRCQCPYPDAPTLLLLSQDSNKLAECTGQIDEIAGDGCVNPILFRARSNDERVQVPTLNFLDQLTDEGSKTVAITQGSGLGIGWKGMFLESNFFKFQKPPPHAHTLQKPPSTLSPSTRLGVSSDTSSTSTPATPKKP